MSAEIPHTQVVPIGDDTRSVVTNWALDTVNNCAGEKDEVIMAAAYCLEYEAALAKAEKEIRRLNMGGAGKPVWPLPAPPEHKG